jgi:DNA-binding CsgD family transcriptional regulator
LRAAADDEAAIDLEDLESLATAAYMVGRDAECADAWTRAYHAYVARGATTRAARCAFWLGWGLFYKGQMAQSGGWFQRAQRLVDEHGQDCPERGLLLVPRACAELFGANDAAAAHARFSDVRRTGERFGDVDLIAFGLLGEGQGLIRLDQRAEGFALLDQAMVAATAGELSPMVAGTVYCAVILECRRVFDVARAVEWTGALKAWCDSDPDLVPYRGQCLVHRSEIMQLRGEWPEAIAEASRAAELLAMPPPQPAVGMAYYQQGELLRLRGEFRPAEEAFREASRWGRDPQPGLALLRLRQGQLDAARAAVTRVLEEADDPAVRAAVLPAAVEVALAANQTSEARAAVGELAAIAVRMDSLLLHAAADQASGAVLLAEGDARDACLDLRRARTTWQDLEAPYEAARSRVLLGLAYQELGDTDAATLEHEAARWVFDTLGAAPDLALLDQAMGRPEPAGKAKAGLSTREIEVLALVVAGRTNREIARALTVSEHTVRRHVQNIFAKIGVSSRAAATAFALRHDLV